MKKYLFLFLFFFALNASVLKIKIINHFKNINSLNLNLSKKLITIMWKRENVL